MIVPVVRRNFFEPLYCFKNSSSKLTYLKKIENTQFLSLEKLQQIQWQRLKKLYAYLWNNNNFYRSWFRQFGLTPESLKAPEDIAKLPILTKGMIRKNSDQMISSDFDKKSLIHYKTGGSTGRALDIYITEECSELRNACARRHNHWTGWKSGEPVGAAWGNPKIPCTLKEKLFHHLLQPFIYLDTMSVSESTVLDFVDKWNKYKPTLLYGHAHSLYVFAQYLLELRCEVVKPKGILSTSMMLLAHERSLIEEVLSCEVTDRYGCEEVSLISCECEEHEGMHINIEHLVVEFIKDDGLPAQPGEFGNIIVTDLMNFAMPFVRYKIEDVGTPMDKLCSCGRGLPLMGKVNGRVADFLIKNDGTKVAGISLIENTLTYMPGIDQMQIVQESLGSFIINIVPNIVFNDKVEKELIAYFNKIFPGSNVSIIKIQEILPESSGKYRFSICNV